MIGFNRRQAIGAFGMSMFAPLFLGADGLLDVSAASGKYTLSSTESGTLGVSSLDEEVRFRVGKNAFMLRKNSSITISTDSVAVTALRLITGGVMGVFGEGRKNILAKTFTAGIRGTGIYLEEQSDSEVYCCLCYGTADFTAPDGRERLMHLDSRHHDRPVSIGMSRNGKSELFDDKTHNHNDDELRALEKMCDRKPPFEEWLKLQEILSPGAYH
jgi:hypothetical protein